MKPAAANKLATSLRFTLKVTVGANKGRSYQLLPPVVTIGRDPENHIRLDDPKISRHQAVIEFKPDRIIIRDLSSRENLILNGAPVRETALASGDAISIGETEMHFRIEALQAQHLSLATQPSPHGLAQAPPRSGPSRPTGQYRAPQRKSSADDGKMLRFIIVILALAGGFAYLFLDDGQQKGAKKGLRTAEEIEASIRTSETSQEQILKDRQFKDEAARTRFEEADKHFRTGFRDYQKGNYSRSMRSFETANAIDPQHERAKRYYNLAMRKRDEFVDRYIREGRKYKEKNMFSRCVGSLDTALKALGDLRNQQDLKIKEAETLRNECFTLTKERF